VRLFGGDVMEMIGCKCGWFGKKWELKKGLYCPNCGKRLKIF